MEKCCLNCHEQFKVLDIDLEFFRTISPCYQEKTYLIPPPSLCPTCRLTRRMSWRNERNLYARKCSKTNKPLISALSPDKLFPVYENSEWWKTEIDNSELGREISLSRSLFQQLSELQLVVPRRHTFNTTEDRQENSLYTNCAGDLKDCFLVFASIRDEKCLYATYLNDSYGCMDCYFVFRANNCYECMDIENCNSLYFSQNCKECFDSYFLFDCRGSSDCIACSGLRQKRYHILNRELSKAEFEKEKARLAVEGLPALREYEARFQKLLLSTPRKNLHGDKNENCAGDFIWNSKDCFECYDTSNADECRYCTWFVDGKRSLDIYAWGEMEFCYEISGGGDKMYQCAFSAMSFGCSNSYYLDHCAYCNDCFACIGLKHKRYCILNKQYTKEAYEALVPKVIETMTQFGEWGEFLDPSFSPYGYNESVAQEYYPLTKEQAIKRGFTWSNFIAPTPTVGELVQANTLPPASAEIRDEILNVGIVCEVSGKPFRVGKEELKFYREHRLPLPRRHPDERHRARVAQRNPRKLHHRCCEKCGEQVLTTYHPQRPEVVFCEACYLETRY